jgi:hypothetical protein
LTLSNISVTHGKSGLDKRVHQAIRVGDIAICAADYCSGLVNLNHMATLDSSLIVALELCMMGNTAVIDETLGTRKVAPVAGIANQFHVLSVRSFQYQWTSLVLWLRIATRQRLQFCAG